MAQRGLLAFTLACLVGMVLTGPVGAAWTRPKVLDRTHPSRVPNGVEVAVSGEAIHVVWRDLKDEVRYSRSLDCGDSWSEPVSLGTLFFNSNLSIAADGHSVHAVWVDHAPDRRRAVFHARSRDRGATWSTPKRRSRLKRDAEDPSIAAAAGEVHIVFHQGKETRFGWVHRPRRIVASSTDGGRSFVRRKLTGRSVLPKIVIGPGIQPGLLRLHLVFSKWGRNGSLLYQVSDDSGAGWSAPTQINHPEGGFVYQEDVAILGAGAHVVWTRIEGQIFETFYNGSVNGRFQPSSRRLSGVSSPTAQSFSSSIGATRDVLYSVWRESSRSGGFTYTARSTDRGGTWSPAEVLDRRTGDPTIIASDARSGRCKGTFHVFYRDGSKYVHRRQPRSLD